MPACSGCGRCCLSEQCHASMIVLGDIGAICPFLRLVEPGFYRCRLVEMEAASGAEPLIARALGIGKGCTNETEE